MGLCSGYEVLDIDRDRVWTLMVSSSVGRFLFGFGLEFCREVAVAQVLSVLSEGVVSEKRCRDILLVSGNSSLKRDFDVSGD